MNPSKIETETTRILLETSATYETFFSKLESLKSEEESISLKLWLSSELSRLKSELLAVKQSL
jgi:hypothetical protein